MATLILTAVGTALGGPVGGALGALAGNALDHDVLFRPGGRAGPRLAELRVQTSSYGDAIPRLFGTMRVAGTVIWATDLIETRSSSRAGKGQPSIENYSYAASFAVLLSARPILAVGRVWADGALIRGAGDDWKVRTGFRLHLGGEEQAIDPLIAAAEGAGLTPAHRGCAYAVFEQLPLAEFGNRIPSLSFEVIADAGPVGVGAIAAELAAEVSGAPALAVAGFAAAGGSVRGVLETLATASGAWYAPVGARLMMRDTAVASPIVDLGGRGAGREVAAADAAPALVTVRHYDPARDGQAGVQRARRPGGANDGAPTLALDVPAALSADAAKGVAEAVLARAAAARVKRTVAATLDALLLAPGDVVTIIGEAGGWRVAAVSLEAMATTLTLVPLTPAPQPAPASAGRVLGAPDLIVGTTLLALAELPALDDALLTQPRLTIVAAGTGAGWRRGALLLSTDDGASWAAAGTTAPAGVIGLVETAPAAAPAALVDAAGALVVTLAHDDVMLADADDAALDRGANLALAGDELIQFGRAAPLGEARWRLTRLWRGRRGTPVGVGPGDRFVLIEADTARTIDLPLAALGGTALVMATGVGDEMPMTASAAVTGASVLPPAPVALRRTVEPDGGATVRWTRRSRAGWRWLDGVDAPLAEESEAYRVTIGARDVVTDVPLVVVTAAERVAGPVTVTVRQRGTYGESRAATIIMEEL